MVLLLVNFTQSYGFEVPDIRVRPVLPVTDGLIPRDQGTVGVFSSALTLVGFTKNETCSSVNYTSSAEC